MNGDTSALGSQTAGTPEKDADTRDRLLAAALQVFANRGIVSATLREITLEADANIAAVNYYFRSKEELTKQVLERYLRPINDARLKALGACIAANEKPAPLAGIIEALVRPMVELSVDPRGGRAIVRLLLQVRALPHPVTNTILAEQFDLIHRNFLNELSTCLPDLTREEVGLRYDFARGAVMQILGDLDPIARTLPIFHRARRETDNEIIVQQLISFITAGFRAAKKEA